MKDDGMSPWFLFAAVLLLPGMALDGTITPPLDLAWIFYWSAIFWVVIGAFIWAYRG